MHQRTHRSWSETTIGEGSWRWRGMRQTMNGGIGNGETSWETSVAMCDNDEQLIPRRPNRSNSLYGGNSDIDNDPGDLVLRTPRSMVRRMVQYSHPTLRGKRNLSNPKPPLMIPSISTNTKQAQFFLFFFFYFIFSFFNFFFLFFHSFFFSK